MIFRDSLGAPFRPIGTVDVPAGKQRNSYETAAWFQEVSYEAQTAIVYSNGYYVKWTVTGTVTDANFQSLYGGMPVGSYDKSKDIGGEASYTFMPYAYGFAEAINDGSYIAKDIHVHLLPEYGVGCAPYQHDPSKIGHFLTMPDSGHPLLVKRIAMAGQAFSDTHTYQVSWRGELLADIEVARKDGFNGDTQGVAIRRATEALSLI